MAYWTIIGKGDAGDTEGKTLGLSLDTDNKTWLATGGSVDLFFSSKSGGYTIIVDTTFGKGTQLKNNGGQVAGFLENLTGTTAVGDSGSGHALEKGETFKWKLDSK